MGPGVWVVFQSELPPLMWVSFGTAETQARQETPNLCIWPSQTNTLSTGHLIRVGVGGVEWRGGRLGAGNNRNPVLKKITRLMRLCLLMGSALVPRP